jgi:hypothetical protein
MNTPPATLLTNSAPPTKIPADRWKKKLDNRTNKFFTARSIADLVAALPDAGERTKWTAEMERIKAEYNSLSETYQKGKVQGTATSSFFQ